MSSDVNLKGLVFTNARPFFADGEADLALNPNGSTLAVLGLPGVAEVTRMGDSWAVASASGVTALNALPTTTAGLTLYNGEAGNGKTYVIDSVGFWLGVAQATTYANTALFGMMNVSPTTVQTGALTNRSLVGKRYGGKAQTLAAATVVNDGWVAIGTGVNAGAGAATGSVWKVQESNFTPGLFQVPPQGSFSLHALSVDVTASSVFFFIRWHEVRHGGIVS